MSTLASHIQTESEAIEALRQSIRDREAECLEACGELDEARARITFLEETLRGILQEKQKQRDLMQSGAIDKAGTKAGEAYEWAKGEIERELAWLESVLGGGK